jgi:ribosome assembly protein 4
MASGSGDKTVRVWDIFTQTPFHTLSGHSHWVQFVKFSPDCLRLASGSMDNTIRIWNPKTGMAHGTYLKGHKKYITGISWEPLHLNINCVHIASASHDGDIRIWDTKSMTCVRILTGHTDEVTQVIWGGEGLIFSASRDR